MGASRKGGWIGGAAILIVITFVATWFLAVAPRFESAAQTLDEAAQVESRNEVLEMQVAALRADHARIEEFRAELVEFQLQIPDEADLDNVLNKLEEHAVASALTIVEIAAAPAIAVTIPAPVEVLPPVAEEPTDESPSEDASSDGTEASEPTPTPAAPQLEGFVAIPITVKVVGSHPAALAFLERVQMADVRLFLVTGLKGTRQENALPGSGRPATVDGDVELEISGYVYVLVNPLLQSVLRADDEQEPQPSDLPPSDRNPFVPLVPSAPVG